MAKYDVLRDHLRRNGDPRIRMSFNELSALVDGLPRSAYIHQAWWANEREPRTHVQKMAWMAAGYLVERVDQRVGYVVFRRRR